MSALQTVLAAGLHLHADSNRLIVTPASLLDDSLRDLIRAHKPELWAAARDAETVGADLIAAIRACCAVRGDSDFNRDALIAEAASLSREHQLDLIAHFNEQAATWRAVSASGRVPAATPVARVPIRPVPSVKTCPQCANRLRFGTCGRPIEAGLIGADEGYGIAWAPPRWAATCRAFAAAGRGVV